MVLRKVLFSVLILLGGLGAGAASGTQVTIAIAGNGSITPTGPQALTFQATGTGNSIPFGPGVFSASGQIVLAPPGNSYVAVGSFRLDFSGGNALSGTLNVPAGIMFPNVGGSSGGSGSAKITGGSGLFAGASGTFSALTGSGMSTGFFSSSFNMSGMSDINVPNFNPTPGAGLRFVPVSPCRAVDTRNDEGPLGGPVLDFSTTRSFPIGASNCSIPANARAYALNVTVVPRKTLSYLTLWATGQSQPYVSTVNSPDGRPKSNAAIVPAGDDGSVSVFVTDATDLAVDVYGYFVPASDTTSLTFYPVPPCRVLDTRQAGPGHAAAALNANETRSLLFTSSNCNIPLSAQAYSINMTAFPIAALGYLTIWPTGQPQPFVSILTSPAAPAVSNAAIVQAGALGSVSVFVTDPADLVIDVNGYFAAPGRGGLLFYPETACRILDTRNPIGPFGGPILSPGQIRTYAMQTSACGIPSTARAYSLNATVLPPALLLGLTLWPADRAQPVTSILSSDGTITSNAAIVPASPDGSISVSATHLTHLILDLNGYFAP